jgi:ATP/maltotriose-dependent transcriptional regulator MalT
MQLEPWGGEMPKRTSTLAKLSRPRLHDTVPREGLFDRLDALAAVPVTLVSAPPGAGKTTLVASYLESRKLGGIWFQADTGDADPATFFYYLGMAEAEMRNGRARRSRLPLLTPEYLADLPGFARRYFRELFARFPESSALVLDNFQEIGDEGALHQAIVGALEEAPRGVRVFLVSRHPLPDVYARLTANRAVGLLGWDEIRLTVEEASGLLEAGRAPVSDEWVRRLHEQSGGWAAGLVLLVEQARRGLAVCPVAAPDSLTQVFAYFADQILQRAPAEERRLLVQMSYLSDISARLARELTGSDAAAALLEHLYRRHLLRT